MVADAATIVTFNITFKTLGRCIVILWIRFFIIKLHITFVTKINKLFSVLLQKKRPMS